MFAVLVAIAAVFGYVGVARQDSAAKQLTGRYYVLQQTAGHMQENFNTSQKSISAYALSGRDVFLLPLAGQRAAFAKNAVTLRQLAPKRLRGFVETQIAAGTQLFAAAGKITRLPPRSPVALTLASGTALTARKFFRANKSMQDYMVAQVRRITDQSKHSLTTGLAWGGAALAMAVALVLAASLSTLRTITWPLRRLTATVRKLTSGDYAARAVVTGGAGGGPGGQRAGGRERPAAGAGDGEQSAAGDGPGRRDPDPRAPGRR